MHARVGSPSMLKHSAFRVEARGYEDIRVDDNPFHSDFIHHKLAKISPKILTRSAGLAGVTSRLGADRQRSSDRRLQSAPPLTRQGRPANPINRDRLSRGGLYHIQHRTGAGQQEEHGELPGVLPRHAPAWGCEPLLVVCDGAPGMIRAIDGMPAAHRASALPRSQGVQPAKRGTRRPLA